MVETNEVVLVLKEIKALLEQQQRQLFFLLENQADATSAYLSIKSASRILGIGEEQTRRLCRLHKIKAFKLGRKYCISQEELDLYILEKQKQYMNFE